VQRERPYCGFNFLVDLGSAETAGAFAGFEEVILPEMWVDVVEYRNGNEKENSARKLTGLEHCGNVVLRRGVVGSLDLYAWYDDVRNGNQNALRTVRIHLQNEDHTEVVMSWKLLRARIVKVSWGALHARGKDVAMEEVVLACERVELE
jgi:phage tail-like protein